MTQRNIAFALSAALALAACRQAGDDSNIAIDNNINATEAAEADVEALPPSESGGEVTNGATPLGEAGDGGSDDPNVALIPAQYHGRWGMVAADCISTRGDNKGLITIADRAIRFYESTASLTEQRPAIATSFSGRFAFTGEGQKWEKVVTLSRTGDTLRRTYDEGSATYRRCP